MRDITQIRGTAAKLWSQLGDAGELAGVYNGGLPEKGVDPARLAELLTRLDGGHAVGDVLGVCVQLASVVPLLAEAEPGSDVVSRAIAGRTVVALAATDSVPGSDLAAMHTKATKQDDGHFVLHGSKRWITNVTHADWLLVLARRRPGPHFTNFSWFLLPACAEGVQVESAAATLFAGSGVGHVRLDGVVVEPSANVGGNGRGLSSFARHLAVERLAGAMWASAICRRVLAETRRRLQGRGSLWQDRVVRDRFARATVAAASLEALVAGHARRITDDHDHAAACVVKAATEPTIDTVLTECGHLHGADAFCDGGVQELRAQSAMFGIAGGATDVVLASLADVVDRVPALAPRAAGSM